ncbi:GGDEF domain-containing protein [Actinokineospora guangxiensis]|uniref:GGDEF domain-containing protein n=1 Tax=Actinokineospora guangxiensis TaxID=1490288 RepID=A0ABW0EYK8_9PSEU
MDRRSGAGVRVSALVVWIAGCAVVAAGWAMRTVGGTPPDAESWWLLLVIVAAALMHAEATRPPQERRRVAHLAVAVEHGAVWALCGALVLPAPLAVVPAVVVAGLGYVRHRGMVEACALIAAGLVAHLVAVLTPARRWVAEGGLPAGELAGATLGLAGAVVGFWLVWRVLPGIGRAVRGDLAWTDLLTGRDDRGDLLIVLALGIMAGWSSGVGHGAPLVAVAVVAAGVTRRAQRIAELTRERDRFELDALHDSLTGLANQRGFNPAAALALVADQARRRPTAVLMLDLDGFRGVNSRLGHLGANEVLKAFAALLRASVRRDDLVCRWGGEEFSIVLPGADRADAWAVAERIRRAVERMTVELTPARGLGTERVGRFTVSGGIALSPVDGTDLTTLQVHADRALAAAKNGGRNQIRLTPAQTEVDATGLPTGP